MNQDFTARWTRWLGRRLGSCALALACLCASQQSSADEPDWTPKKTITIIVPSNPGGGWDQTARFLQRVIVKEGLSPVAVEVVNRGGAGGTIGLNELVARYRGDPYKLLMTGSVMSGAVVLHRARYDLSSATPIARLSSEYQALGVPADSPYRSLEDFIAALRAAPEKVSVGGGSAGGADQTFAALLMETAGVEASKLNYVAFTGGGEVAAALAGGQVSAGVSSYSEWRSLVDARKVRLLAISSPERLDDPDLPTFRELGYDIEFENWRGVLAAPGISEAQKEWLTDLIARARASESWRELLERSEWQDSFLTGPALAAFLSADSDMIRAILGRIGIGPGGEGYSEIGPYFFPKAVSIGLAALILLLAWSNFKSSGRLMSLLRGEGAVSGERPDAKRFALALAALAAYAAGLSVAGFLFSTPPFMVVTARLIGSRAVIRDIIASAVLIVGVALVFENLLHVDIP